MTFVRARLALERLPRGATLLVLLTGTEPRERVAPTMRSLGHEVLEQVDGPGEATRLLLRRG